MDSLTIAWEYLTGYAVATDPTTRDRVEWPPHPARVYMAVAAAWFETEPSGTGADHAEWDAEGEALRWLEALGDPEMILPVIDRESERTSVTFYVPVNDRVGPASASLQSCPSITRSKQPRTFPRLWVDHRAVCMRWPNAQGAERYAEALDRLCRKVTRIGHSSSLVSMWVASAQQHNSGVSLHPDAATSLATHRVRSITSGVLDVLRERFGEEPRRLHANLSEEIDRLEAERKAIRGKGAADARAEMDTKLKSLKDRITRVVPRAPVRPTMGLWTGYGGDQAPVVDAPTSQFDADVLVLTQIDGAMLPATATLTLTKALRDTIMSKSPKPVPEWVSGHQPNGLPSANDGGHLAIVPLPFVGHEHADGHVLGVGLVFPRSIPANERGRVLGHLLVDNRRQARTVELTLGRLGVCIVRKRDWEESRYTLSPEAWTATQPRAGGGLGARCWATVTPVVLDRFPKADRHQPGQREEWEDEVRAMVKAACVRIGLPEPEMVDVDTTSWHLGSPRAVCKRRPLRGHQDTRGPTDAALGDGFPTYPARGDKGSRPQLHVWLRFPEPVIGPMLLGAGRYMGYGFCKPWEPRRT
jgi:CRISPR-associated protein Csb2